MIKIYEHNDDNKFSILLHEELPQRWHGGKYLLNKVFYAGNGKRRNALQFLQAEEDYKPQ